MARSMSIHIGVNQPLRRSMDCMLQYSEITAWRMAELASQAGYNSLQVLRGDEATKPAVHQALTTAAATLAAGDTLLLTFCGHGVQVRDTDGDERDGRDESWILSDGILLDDTLADYWGRFATGVRIVIVSESCYSGGAGRDDEDQDLPGPRRRPGRPRWFRGSRGDGDDADAGNPCIVAPPRNHDDIRASVLMLCASGEGHTARENLFTRHLLDLWDGGTFRGSYCDLYRRVQQKVTDEHAAQIPSIVMLGAPDPELSMAPAFHLNRPAGPGRHRGGGRMAS